MGDGESQFCVPDCSEVGISEFVFRVPSSQHSSELRSRNSEIYWNSSKQIKWRNLTFSYKVITYQHLKNRPTQRNVVLYNNEISDGERCVPHLVCQKVNTQTSRDPSRAAPIRPEFELGIYEFTWLIYEFELGNSDFRAVWNAACVSHFFICVSSKDRLMVSCSSKIYIT